MLSSIERIKSILLKKNGYDQFSYLWKCTCEKMSETTPHISCSENEKSLYWEKLQSILFQRNPFKCYETLVIQFPFYRSTESQI